MTILAEIGDLSRFASPRELMGYLGLVRPTIVVTAIAREICGFIWAIDRAMRAAASSARG